MSNFSFASRMAALPKHHKLIVYSYASLYEYITKIRMLNKATRKLTDNSYIGREDRHWEIQSPSCWLCHFERQHLQAIMIGADTLQITMEDFVDEQCKRHSPFKQLLELFLTLPLRMKQRKISCYFDNNPEVLRTYLEVCAIKTQTIFDGLYQRRLCLVPVGSAWDPDDYTEFPQTIGCFFRQCTYL